MCTENQPQGGVVPASRRRGGAAGEGYRSGMATLSFEGETHTELVAKVRRWLTSVEGEEEVRGAVDVINASGELAKDALRIIASAAPAPVAQSEVVKGLTALGYQVTDTASSTLVDALDALSNVTSDRMVKRVRNAGAGAVFEMNKAVAAQLLKGFRQATK